MATKNVVAVNHLNNAGPYLFEVPAGKTVGYGQLCLAQTKTGKQVHSIALCDSFEVDDQTSEYEAVLKMYKATVPLQPIIGTYTYVSFTEETTPADETPAETPSTEPADETTPSETDGE